MQQQLTPDAFKILSESYKKIGEIGVKIVELKTGLKQQSYINQLIDVTMLYRVIMAHIVLNDSGTAIAAVVNQEVPIINDLLFSLRESADLPKLPIFPMPLTTYEFKFGNGAINFDIGPGNLGDLIVHNGTVFTNFSMGPPGTVLTSSPTGLVWSANSGNGLPSGGSTNQYLRKNSNTSFDVVWDTLSLSKIPDVTASAAEVNILDGATLTTVELNYVDGVTSPIQAQLDSKMTNSLSSGQFFVGNVSNVATPVSPTGDVTFTNAGVFSITAGVIVDADISSSAAIGRAKLANGTANRLVVNSSIGAMTDLAAIAPSQVLVSNSNGLPEASPVTAATLVFLDATSSVQTQLDNKLTVSVVTPAGGDLITYNGTNWINFPIGTNGQVLTSNGTSVYWGSSTANGIPAGGTAAQYLRKVDGSDYNTEWHTLIFSDITNVSTSAAEINLLSGLTVNATQLNFLTGVGNNVQTQLDNKQDNALAYNAIWVGNASNKAAELAPGTNDYVLTMVGGTPQWQPTTPPGNVSGVSPTVVNTIARWNDTAGSSIKGTGIVIDNSNNISAAASITLNTAGALRTSTSAANTLLLQAYDVDGTAYTTFATLTAGNTPTMDLSTAVTIAGQYIYRVGGTDISLADGGTGASLTSPGADRIMFWDQSAGQVTWLQVGANLSITGTTLNATGGGGAAFQQREQSGTAYTIQASDSGYLIYFTDPAGCTVTIPIGLTANFTFTSARAEGAGVVNHVSDGTSVLHTINGDTDIQNENTAVTWAFKGTNDWYGFGALGAGGGGGGSVNSVSGTTNRITIGGTGADPTVDIAATYVGQTSITTLGTIATGVWNATTIGINKGGTGLTALGTANQMVRVNAGATALEYFTPTYISGNQTITLTGDVAGSGTTGIVTAIQANVVDNTMIRQSAGLSLIGRASNSTGNIADIIAANDGEVMRRSGTAIGFGTIATAGIGNSQVTYAKIQNVPAGSLLGRYTASTGVVQEVTIGTGLALNSTTGVLGVFTTEVTITGTTYTIQESDNNKYLVFTSNSPIVVTLPPGLSTSLNCVLVKNGTGDITLSTAGTYEGTTNTIVVRYTGAIVYHSGGNAWKAYGSLGAAATGTVTNVSGTLNRIIVGSGTTTPIIDIAPSYVGQTSITTLGTITTGTWSGTTISTARGGTGLTSIGTALQVLRVNAGATALEYATLSVITGSGASGQVPYFNGTSSLTSESGFEYDAVNNRLSVANVRATTYVVVDDSTKGIVQKSPNGHYWLKTIDDSGDWNAGIDLGTSLP